MTLEEAKILGMLDFGLSQEQVDNPKFNETVLEALQKLKNRAVNEKGTYPYVQLNQDFDRLISLNHEQLTEIHLNQKEYRLAFPISGQSNSETTNEHDKKLDSVFEQRGNDFNKAINLQQKGMEMGLTTEQVSHPNFTESVLNALTKSRDKYGPSRVLHDYSTFIELNQSQLKGLNMGLTLFHVTNNRFGERILKLLEKIRPKELASGANDDDQLVDECSKLLELSDSELLRAEIGFDVNKLNISKFSTNLKDCVCLFAEKFHKQNERLPKHNEYDSYILSIQDLNDVQLKGIRAGLSKEQVYREGFGENAIEAINLIKITEEPIYLYGGEEGRKNLFNRALALNQDQVRAMVDYGLTLGQVESEEYKCNAKAILEFVNREFGNYKLETNTLRDRFEKVGKNWRKEQIFGCLLGLKRKTLKANYTDEAFIAMIEFLDKRRGVTYSTVTLGDRFFRSKCKDEVSKEKVREAFDEVVGKNKKQTFELNYNVPRDIVDDCHLAEHVIDGIRGWISKDQSSFLAATLDEGRVRRAFNQLKGLNPEQVKGRLLGLNRSQLKSPIFANNTAVILEALKIIGACPDSRHSRYFGRFQYLKECQLTQLAEGAQMNLTTEQILAERFLNHPLKVRAIKNVVGENKSPEFWTDPYNAVTRLDNDVQLRGLALGIDPEKVGLKLKGAEFSQLNEETDVALSHALLDTVETLQKRYPWQSPNIIFDEVVELTDIQKKGIVNYGLSLEEVRDKRFVGSENQKKILEDFATSIIGEELEMDGAELPLKRTAETHEIFEEILTKHKSPSTHSNISGGVLEENQFDRYLELLAGQIDVHSRLTAPDNLESPVQYETKASHKDARESEGAYEGEKKMPPEQKRVSQESQQPVLDEQQRREAMDLELGGLAKAPPHASRLERSASIEQRTGQKRKGNQDKNTPSRSKKPRFSI